MKTYHRDEINVGRNGGSVIGIRAKESIDFFSIKKNEKYIYLQTNIRINIRLYSIDEFEHLRTYRRFNGIVTIVLNFQFVVNCYQCHRLLQLMHEQ